MGIELPKELSAVAAQAGVQWPEADEDHMRQAAHAWRDAGTRLTTLTTDADHTARTTLTAVHGDTGDAARRHWSAFVHPDTGHLTATARGCLAAADRLDHAANQVSAAKVEIVRNLVDLAKNTDAAHHAANAGHPHALLGLDTAVRGTAANVTHISNNLVTAVQPATGVQMSGVHNVVDANPGAHGPAPAGSLLDTAGTATTLVGSTTHGATTLLGDTGQGATTLVGDTAHGATNLVGDAGHGATNVVADPGHGVTNLVGDTGHGVTNLVGDTAHGATNLVVGTGQGATNLVGGTGQGATNLVGDTGHGVTNLVGDPGHGAGNLAGDAGTGGAPGGPGHALPALGNPDITGPVTIPPLDDGGPGHAGPHLDAPTPPTGTALGQPGSAHLPGPGLGQTVQAGYAGVAGFDPSVAAPAPGPAAGLAGALPTPGGGPPGQVPGFAPGPGGGGLPSGGLPGGGPPAPGGAPGYGAPSSGPAPGGLAGPRVAAAAPGAPPGVVPPGGAPPDGSRARGPVPTDAPRARGQVTMAVPPGPPAQPAPPGPLAPAPRERPADAAVLFWVHMFPIGHMPVVSDRPARQLPPPPAELDYAPGLRFAPGDHPEHHLVAGAWRLDELRAGVPPLDPSDGLPADHPRVADLAAGHDPLGGEHERDWDRRYLVRLGSVTAQGISSEGKEYAWPPGECYPEGGTAPGEPELLAEGTVIDRFGPPGGRVFSADGTAFARRSLPPELLASGYRRYRVTRPLPVWRTICAPWFAQPGGAERYRATYSAAELLALGYLADITGGDG